MSVTRAPSVFVSSTCYDLSQVRKDLESFIESMSMLPILSESSSFPVNPSLNAIDNCLASVKEKADIFILVVGGRYGSKTENGKSVTNLEYLEAKLKGIPCYVFVQKPILTAFSIWQKNRSCDFSEFVDSPKLFEFVESLYDPIEKNWIFPFESAQDIIAVLRTQLAYLFMDALAIRAKLLRNDLSEALQDLSGAAIFLIVQKPFSWKSRFFCQVLRDEISRMESIRKDLNYGIALGNVVRLDNPSKVMEWVQIKGKEFLLFIQSAGNLANTALPKALGSPEEPGDIKEIIYVAKRFSEVYRRILEWTIEFKHIQVENELAHLLELISGMSKNVIEEIESFPLDYNQRYIESMRRYEESKQPQSFEIPFTCPDMTELNKEFSRLMTLLDLDLAQSGHDADPTTKKT
jgi:hypothetical protein